MLENFILPGSGLLVGWLAADFVGPEDAIASFLLDQFGNKELTGQQAKEMVWAINGITIAVYSIVVLAGLGLWSSNHTLVGPFITGVGAGLIANKVVDTFLGHK